MKPTAVRTRFQRARLLGVTEINMKNLIIALIVSVQFGCAASIPIENENVEGSSFENAVSFPGVKDMFEGISHEKQWLQKNYPNARLKMQASAESDGKVFDIFTINTSRGAKKVYFDVTDWYGKVQ